MESALQFENLVPQLALHSSRLRQIGLLSVPDRLDAIPSTAEQMAADWQGAVAQYMKGVLTSSWKFSTHNENSLEKLSLAWLDDVKNLIAYTNWQSRSAGDGVWFHEENKANDFNQACQQISGWLLDKRFKQNKREFAVAKRYLQSRYLNEEKLSPGKDGLKTLTKRKAARIWDAVKNTDDHQNWIGAEQYVQGFYSNIVPAVEDADVACTERILNALQDRCGTNHRSLVVSGLEAALAICFLDADVIRAFEKKNGRVF